MSLTDKKNILFTRSLSSEHIMYAEKLGLEVTAKPFIQIDLMPLSKEKTDLINSKPESNWIFTSQNAVKSIAENLSSLISLGEKKVFAVGEKTAEELLKIGIEALLPEQHNSQSLLQLLEKQSASSYIHFSGNLRQNNISDFMTEKEFDFEEIECYQTNLHQPDVTITDFDAICFCSPSAVYSFFNRYKINETVPCFAIGSTTAVKLLDFSEHVVMSENTNVYSLLEICHNYLNS
ncbi:uroporphyrinogen-III synthase [Labilibaculum euxinus]